MSPTVYLALFGWIPVVLALFVVLPVRRAIIAAYVAGWLLLPVASLSIAGFPDYSKLSATSLGVVLGIAVFDVGRIFSFRPSLADAPLLLWLLCPVPSSVYNGLGPYDGASESFRLVLNWGIPIFVGRLYFGRLEALRELAIGLMLGAMVYVPLCWIEFILSPQLHTWLYGYFPHRFDQAMRYGGYRPVVFMKHQLSVAMYLAAGAFLTYWAGRVRSPRELLGVPIRQAFYLLAVTTVLCKTGNGIVTMLLGVAGYHAIRQLSGRLILLALAAAPPAYMAGRLSGVLPAESLIEAAAAIDARRALSLGARLEQEEAFSRHTWEKPWFGWGGWMRNWPKKENGKLLVGEVDGMWTITLSKHGVFGLSAWTATVLIGPLLYAVRLPPQTLMRTEAVYATALAVLCLLHVTDNLMNDFKQPMFVLAMGGLTTLAVRWGKPARRSQPRAALVRPPAASPPQA